MSLPKNKDTKIHKILNKTFDTTYQSIQIDKKGKELVYME